MGKGKIAHGFLRTIFMIVALVLGIGGILMFLLVTPVYATTTTVLGESTVVGTGYEPFKFIFGGDATSYIAWGDLSQEIGVTLKFDYFAFIGLIFGVVAIVLGIFLYNNKIGMAIASFSALAACVFGACEGLTFCFVNELPLGEIVGIGGLAEAVASVVPVGGSLFATCFGILFILSIIRTITIKLK